MSFRPTYKIIIGKYFFDHANLVRVFSSRKTLADSAIIQLPSKYKETQIHKLIKVGDPVQIWLAYDNRFTENPDFEGFVSEPLQLDFPIRITCKDSMFLYGRKKPQGITLTDTTLKGVIEYLMPGQDLTIPEIKVDQFIISSDVTIAKYLEKIQTTYGFDIYFRNNVLFVGLAYTDSEVMKLDPVVYNLQRNVINNDLTYKSRDDVKIRLKAISLLPDNTKIEYKTGDEDGEERTMHFYNMTQESLKLLADEKLDKLKYDGYYGSIRTFGNPNPVHGQIAQIINGVFDMKGEYFINAVNTTSGYNEGFRRNIEIGKKAG